MASRPEPSTITGTDGFHLFFLLPSVSSLNPPAGLDGIGYSVISYSKHFPRFREIECLSDAFLLARVDSISFSLVMAPQRNPLVLGAVRRTVARGRRRVDILATRVHYTVSVTHVASPWRRKRATVYTFFPRTFAFLVSLQLSVWM